MTRSAWVILFMAALFEFLGDALIRWGLPAKNYAFVGLAILGLLVLCGYGVGINIAANPEALSNWINTDLPDWLRGAKLNMSELFGVYVAIFALVSVSLSALLIDRKVPSLSTFLGTAIIVLGGLVINRFDVFTRH